MRLHNEYVISSISLLISSNASIDSFKWLSMCFLFSFEFCAVSSFVFSSDHEGDLLDLFNFLGNEILTDKSESESMLLVLLKLRIGANKPGSGVLLLLLDGNLNVTDTSVAELLLDNGVGVRDFLTAVALMFMEELELSLCSLSPTTSVVLTKLSLLLVNENFNGSLTVTEVSSSSSFNSSPLPSILILSSSINVVEQSLKVEHLLIMLDLLDLFALSSFSS